MKDTATTVSRFLKSEGSKSNMRDMAKMLIFFGVLLCAAGIFLFAASRLFHGRHLPGDIVVKKGNFTFYFPLATSFLISVVLTFLLNAFLRRR